MMHCANMLSTPCAMQHPAFNHLAFAAQDSDNHAPLIAIHGCCYMQVGPELEICGYGCEDHFNENDTEEHSWECLQVSPPA